MIILVLGGFRRSKQGVESNTEHDYFGFREFVLL